MNEINKIWPIPVWNQYQINDEDHTNRRFDRSPGSYASPEIIDVTALREKQIETYRNMTIDEWLGKYYQLVVDGLCLILGKACGDHFDHHIEVDSSLDDTDVFGPEHSNPSPCHPSISPLNDSLPAVNPKNIYIIYGISDWDAVPCTGNPAMSVVSIRNILSSETIKYHRRLLVDMGFKPENMDLYHIDEETM
jgi:hypothetical protein